MQAELNGNFLYIYTGRNPLTWNPQTKQIIYKMDDPFAKVQIIRVDMISNVEIDYKEESLKIYVNGMNYPIFCTFGTRNCYRINCFHAFVDVIAKAMKFSGDYYFNLERRNEQTALSYQPEEAHQEEDDDSD